LHINLQAPEVIAVQELGIKFLLASAQVVRLRGLLALQGAFEVLVACASNPLFSDLMDDRQSDLALEALVEGV